VCKCSFYIDDIWQFFINIDGCLSELIITLIVITCAMTGTDHSVAKNQNLKH
jgi:hypothetical protein